MKKNIPFIRFNHLGKENIVMSNIFGDSMVLKNNEFKNYIDGNINNEKLEKDLKDKYFIKNDTYISDSVVEYQKRNFINFIGPTLHIIVLTKGCNHQCKYCHAAADYRHTDDSLKLNKENAKKIVDIILQSPAEHLTIEFQGGEPTTNFDIIDYIINYADKQAIEKNKKINYALVSNLTTIDEPMLEKIFTYKNLNISTSLDGSKEVHDFNRLLIGDKKTTSSYESLKEAIERIRKKEKETGKKVLYGAMGVITRKTLPRYKELVDTYIELGFESIFLKKLNPLGFASITKDILGYSAEKLEKFYSNYYDYLIELDQKGTFISDGFLNICIQKILNPHEMNYMDLRSPCGAGIGQIAYDYTGDIYTCDEGRMTDDGVFKIGDTNDNLETLVQNETVGAMMDASTVESLPCDVCAYAPFCGVCPIESYSQRGNIYTNQAFDSHCKFFTFIFDYIFEGLKEGKGSKYEYIIKHK